MPALTDDLRCELEALSVEYETATPERSLEIYNRLLEIGAGMGSDGRWRARDPEWAR